MKHGCRAEFKCNGGRGCLAREPESGVCDWVDVTRMICDNPRVRLNVIDGMRSGLIATIFRGRGGGAPETDEEWDERLKKGK